MEGIKNTFRVNNFDLLRIFAATQVLLQHAFKHLRLDPPFWFSLMEKFSGVPIFFVISGYLISTSYERTSDLKNYLRNRFLRIYPALWCCIFLTIITFSFFLGVTFIHKSAPVWLLSQLAGFIYTPGFLKNFGIGSYNGSLWTIPIELQFYLMLPLIYISLNWMGAKVKKANIYFYAIFAAFFIFAFVFNSVFPQIEDHIEGTVEKLLRYSFFPHFYLFLAGVVLQRLQAYKSSLIYGKGGYWLVLYLLFVYLMPLSLMTDLISTLMLGLLTISMAYTVPGIAHKFLRGNDVSYGVYIYHGLLLNVFVALGKFKDYNYLYLVILTTFLMAFLSWRFVEQPFIKWKRETIASS